MPLTGDELGEILNAVGVMYYTGEGTAINRSKSLQYYQKAAYAVRSFLFFFLKFSQISYFSLILSLFRVTNKLVIMLLIFLDLKKELE